MSDAAVDHPDDTAGDTLAAGVAETEGASGFTVSLENFDGPFDLLLGLIAKRQMDVTTVALAAVTDEFVGYVRRLSAEAGAEEGFFSPQALDESSNFILVAATLLDLKAAQLLPSGEVDSEEDLAALEARDLLFARLLQYRAFKEIASQVQATFDENSGRFARQPGSDPQLAGLLPELVWRTTPEDLRAIAEKAFARPAVEPDDVRLEHLHAPVVTVREEVATMATRLRAAGMLSFSELVRDAENRMVVVVRFLGLLELFRDRDVDLSQDSPLGELMVSWSGPAEGETPAAHRAATEWDDGWDDGWDDEQEAHDG
ncbi:segregation and condensation protein A [Nesterenkonia suensis]